MTTTLETTQPVTATVYTQPGCVQCHSTFKWLTKNGITYTAVNVSQDLDAYEYLQNLGYRSVPVVITSTGDHWSGFQPDKLAELL